MAENEDIFKTSHKEKEELPEELQEPKETKEEEKIDSFLGKFRKGVLNKVGKVGSVLFMIAVPSIIKGVMVKEAFGKEALIKDKEVKLEKVGPQDLEKFQKKTELPLEVKDKAPINFIKDLSLDDLKQLQEIAPDYLSVEEGDENESGRIDIYYGVNPEEADDYATEKIIQGEHQKMDSTVYFTWGERTFTKTEAQKGEEEMLKESIKDVFEQTFKSYKDWKIPPNTAIDKLSIKGDVFSSPEGHDYPDKNLRLSQKRAELAKKIVNEMLEEYGFDTAKIDVQIEGRGARGDLLDMAEKMENIGWKFKSADDKGRRHECEEIIRNIHDSKWNDILNKLPKEVSEKLVKFIYDDTVAKHRAMDLKIDFDTKDLGVLVALPDSEFPPDTPALIKEKLKEQMDEHRRTAVNRVVKEYARPTEEAEELFEIVLPEEGEPPPEPPTPEEPPEKTVVPPGIPDIPKSPPDYSRKASEITAPPPFTSGDKIRVFVTEMGKIKEIRKKIDIPPGLVSGTSDIVRIINKKINPELKNYKVTAIDGRQTMSNKNRPRGERGHGKGGGKPFVKV